MTKKILFSALFLSLYVQSYGQNISGYYMSWNVDYTQRNVRPSTRVSEEDSKIVNCYFVSFNEQNQFSHVKFYSNGKPNPHSSYGAFQMRRKYTTNTFEEHFFNESGERVKNAEGVYRIVYYLNNNGYWIKKEHLDEKNQLIDVKGPHSQKAAISIVSRDSINRLATEVRLRANRDTIPDINGFKIVHFGFNKDGFISYRKYLNSQGQLKNGTLGYAQVNFQCHPNGSFFEEEFRNENHELVEHPRLLFARVNFRQFNKYGKYQRIYYIDQNGYPDQRRAYLELYYNSNMTIDKGVFYDRFGKKTEDPRGVASFKFEYGTNGKSLSRVNYNVEGIEIK